MKQIVCETCGGKELIKQDGMFVCQSCGTKYSPEDAKKLIVKIDNSDKLENALKNARRARECENSEQAEKYYEMVLIEEAENWEAIFYTTYLKAMRCSIFGISLAADSVSKCIKTVLKNIKKIEDNIQQNEAIKQISTDLFTLSLMLHNAAINCYNNRPFKDSLFFVKEEIKSEQECSEQVLNSAYMLLTFGDELVSEFGENDFTNPIIIQCYETSLEQLSNTFKAKYIKKEFLAQYVEKLRKYKPLYNPPKKESIFAFLTKPIDIKSSDGCGCGCLCGWLPAFFRTPIFIIILFVIIGTILYCDDKRKIANRTPKETSANVPIDEIMESEKPEEISANILIDPKDGRKYKAVKISKQVWMAENLNYNANGSKCYDNNKSNCQKYGRLYNWNTANKVCPSGWHLPSNEEWQKLVNIAGGNNVAGAKLKAKSGWDKSGNGTNAYDFSALPGGGYSYSDGIFDGVGSYGNWWSATGNNVGGASTWGMGWGTSDVYWLPDDKSSLLSVRCVKN